ncbi:MAG: GSCFA domain-containing protein, partial [Candidatus Eremiobacteraeota bacterium]|nr:GSCFA domain-containing protein [Candidatus Eremiobacteraeota bacterium]
MKIYVLGSCQAIPIADCLTAMNPGVVVERYFSRTDLSDAVTADDVVFRQRETRVMSDPRRPRNEFLYPRIWFNAFHPDVVYVTGPPGPVEPPLGGDHSSLVLYAWHRRMSVAETVKLFVEPVFAQLGFLDCWDAAKRALFEEGEFVGFPLDAIFARLERHGCFMRTPGHPALIVAAEIARELSRRAGLPIASAAPEYYLDDPMVRMAVWPVYPEVGHRLGLPGGYAFKPGQPPSAAPVLLDLPEFIARSFEAYAQTPPDALTSKRLENPAYRELETVIAGERTEPRERPRTSASQPERREERSSPYAGLPPSRFWRRAVERVPAGEVDPVSPPPFRIDRKLRIATAGSCFAQNMSRALVRHGYNYFVAEPPPPGLAADAAPRAGYGVFSTRCGNIYTARQLLQLFDRAYGTFAPQDRAWLRPDGRYVDPFRPQIEPDGFASVDDVNDARDVHLASVRAMFEQLDVFIFTLGLTEAWRSAADGAVFPLAPGVVAGRMDAERYEFVNFSAAEVRDDLDAFLRRLRAVNARARIVLTVSPQPPIATYEPRHVLVSATYTKAALRVAADEIERLHTDVWYFPGYEVVAGGFNHGAYYERDLRTVTAEGVDHVMRLFLAHGDGEAGEGAP